MSESQTIDIGRALRILWANLWILILTIGIAAAGAYLWASHQPKIFQSTALVRAYDAADASPGASKDDASRAVDIQVLYAKSQEVVTDYKVRMGLQLPKITSTSVTAVANADALSIAVQAKNKKAAIAGATNYASAYIEKERAALARSAAGQSAALTQRAGDVQKQIDMLDTEIAQLQPTEGPHVDPNAGHPVLIPETERLRNLSLERETLAQKYADLVDQAGEAQATGSNQQAAIDFVQQPTQPKQPVSPKRLSDTIIAALVGLFLGLVLVLLRNRVRGRIVTSDDVKEAEPDIPFVVAVPPNGSRLRRRSTPTMPSDIGGALAESYRSVTAWLRLMRKAESSSVVLITSSLASEGKTTVCLNLAITLSEAGERVLLVDCDLRHPNMHEVFSIPNNVGYSSVIKAQVPVEQAITHLGTQTRPLDVLPAGPRTSSPTELLLSAEADRVLGVLKTMYDFILIDSSPVLPVSDALTLSRSVDQVLMVVKAEKTMVSDFKHGVDLLRQFGAPVEGAALVGAKHEPASTYVGYYPAELRPATSSGNRRKHGNAASGRSGGGSSRSLPN